MKYLTSILLFLLICSVLQAQEILYAVQTKIGMWNENAGSWVPILERNDDVTLTLTKDRSMLLMYCKGSGLHFKYFYKENGKDMMMLIQDTTFYRIESSEVVKDINGNLEYIIYTESGAENKDYEFHYNRKDSVLVCFFYNEAGRSMANLFKIKSGHFK